MEKAAASVGCEELLKTETESSQDSLLQNIIIGRLADGVVLRHKNAKTSVELWTGLKGDFDQKNALVQAYLTQSLHSLICKNVTKVDEHLDKLLEIWSIIQNKEGSVQDADFINLPAKTTIHDVCNILTCNKKRDTKSG
jgi:hypothetical protein